MQGCHERFHIGIFCDLEPNFENVDIDFEAIIFRKIIKIRSTATGIICRFYEHITSPGARLILLMR